MNRGRRFVLYGAVPVALSSAVFGVIQAQGSSGRATLCGGAHGRSGYTKVAARSYEVMVGEWFAHAPLCVSTDGGPDFTITRSAINLDMVGAFPNISTTGPANGLPVQIARMGNPASTWQTVSPRWGEYDVTYDITIGRRRDAVTWAGGSEVMVWLNTRGHPYPLGRVVATNVPVSGADYTIRVLPSPAGTSYQTIVTFLRQRQTRSVTNLNLGRVIRLAARYGRIPASMYLVRVQAGIELIKGGAGFATKYFSYRRG